MQKYTDRYTLLNVHVTWFTNISVRNFRRVLVNPFYRLIEHRQVPTQKRFTLTIQLDTGLYQKA